MTSHIIETVTFKLNDGVSHEQFLKAAQALNAFVESRTGFVARRLSCSAEGLWIEHIEWADMDAAKGAAAAIGSVEANRPLLSAIDGASVAVHHSALEIAVN